VSLGDSTGEESRDETSRWRQGRSHATSKRLRIKGLGH
jgi:hypothetical protein